MGSSDDCSGSHSGAASGSQSAAAGMAELETGRAAIDNHSLRVLLHIARSRVRNTARVSVAHFINGSNGLEPGPVIQEVT